MLPINSSIISKGLNLALARLNYEISGVDNTSWVNDMPSVDVGRYQFDTQKDGSQLTMVRGEGIVRVGQVVEAERARNIVVLSTKR